MLVLTWVDVPESIEVCVLGKIGHFVGQCRNTTEFLQNLNSSNDRFTPRSLVYTTDLIFNT